jgi:NADPH2:quinone reductase
MHATGWPAGKGNLMKAMIIRSFGGPEVFEPADLPRPETRPGHVLIHVVASSLNPLETKIRSGAAANSAPPFPAILNGDFSGRIVEVGPDSEPWRIGDNVFGCAGGVGSYQGALAEYMLADARLIARKPESISHQTAALFPLAAITAWESVMKDGFAAAGDRVLVHGASGGVGHLAAQLLRLQGVTTYGTVTSREKAEVALNFGSDDVIVSTEENLSDFKARITGDRGFDAVFDTVGGAHLLESFEAVRLRGTVCTISSRTTLELSLMQQKALTLRVVYMLLPLLHSSGREHHGQILTKIARLIDAGALRVHQADRTFAFSEIADAHRYYATRQAIGKISLVNRFVDNPA